MKQIQPVVFPLNLGTATILNAYCINDNLSTSATFYYSLLSDTINQLQEGNLIMSGTDYNDWSTNDYAHNWVSEQLNVTIIADYIAATEEIVPNP